MKRLLAILFASALGLAGAAPGIAAPTTDTQRFHPRDNPCDSRNDHPNCPGPH